METNSLWRHVQTHEGHTDFERELVAFPDQGPTFTYARLTFDAELHAANILVGARNGEAGAKDLLDVPLTWEQGLAMLAGTNLHTHLQREPQA